ncbi:MAG: bifunctional aspartate kinase/homoserine dehydrogenase I [Sphingobacteriales bacterium]|nr:MAG: bifunctional aspartate kinase/homoserine dehydrogenase I [Sphingobacteriales bacterium]
MKVLKFGGTSMGSASAMKQVIAIVKSKQNGKPVVAVVSAMSGTTDVLLNAGVLAAASDESYKELLKKSEERHLETARSSINVQQQSATLSMLKKLFNEIEDICNGIYLLGELTSRTKDKLMSYGELLSSQLITAAFISDGVNAVWKDARELIVTNANYGNAAVDAALTQQLIDNYFIACDNAVVVVPGFVARNANGVTTTLGRGGSDYTAAIIGAAVNAACVEIWTDVSGMMTADPRMVPNAKIISNISYQEAMELSHFGAKVIYPPTIQPVMKKEIPVWVKNTFAPDDFGTLIESKTAVANKNICGISNMAKMALLSLEGSGMVGIPGFSKRLFEALANEQVNVILITQSSSEHSICVAIEEASVAKAQHAVGKAFEYEMETGKIDPLVVEKGLAVIALVGDNMKSHTGIAGKMFGALGRNGVNIRAIAQGSSERNISAVIAGADVAKAINVLHEEFFETTYKQVNLFVIGTGNVGKKLLGQLKQQQAFLESKLRLQVNVVGLSNSRKMLINEAGIDLNNWEAALQGGQQADLNAFINTIIDKNLRNAVVADITANDTVAKVYDQLLQKSIAVVACNKVAASSAYSNYKKLKDLSREFNSPFLFETNVGAGLPVIGTLNDLMSSGDTINKIEAVLSGTLNFVFNNYDGSRPFAAVVKQAQDEGYTEPDPRLDLSGTDVMRKIMILAREAGVQLEMEAITNSGFMPASCMTGSVDDFYKAMEKEEAHFKKIYEAAAAANCKLKFVAKYENGKAAVGLQHIPAQHDFYHLYGKDNIVLFITERYSQQPLVVKGAGAGAEVTASGVFADIIRASKM